ncbi:hypothetical protein APS56_07720 [Pseudalgibacter alginicilyticus]|uniref:Putative auto-transporter adhesin head GIN domain-containing protein n=1 Tax=Pseudalgibacter alginicilyticus TaxID=1736674 RepID=A0A0P0D8D5_9FLAO|nr:DUF2807 domain-containing protein [Pseudalgibacter alginicilyticus]ALJ05018.1 hypothetical protein APS56_07720 [Pseudalgibacter alginicilyticus]
MAKSTFALFFTPLLCIMLHAQKPEKVKGNRNVIIQETLINPFHTVSIDEDFEIEIIYNKIPSVEIEADENLHEFIEFEVRNDILSFNKTKRITSKKKLNIIVKYNDMLHTIETNENSEIKSLTTMELNNATLITYGSSKADLTINTNQLILEGKERSKVKLDLISEHTNITLVDNSKLDGLINSPELHLNLSQRANANLNGNGENLIIKANNYSQFIGKDFTVKTCEVICDISSDATIDVTESIMIEASGTSSIYLYNNPKITINRFTDTTKLQKKVK